MKQSNFFKRSILAILLSSTSIIFAQDVVSDFSWVSPFASNSSTGTIVGCHGTNINVELVTSSLSHIRNSNQAAKIPGVSSSSNTQVTLNFSPAIYDLSLLVADFDDQGGESGTGFTPVFSSISPFGTSPVFVGNSAGTSVSPNGMNNTNGWINWDGAISSVSFTYNRNTGYIITLEEMTFNCEPTSICVCSPKNEFIKIGLVSDNGQTSSKLKVHSGGKAISTLNISIPFWKSLVNPNCIDGCNKKALLNSGNIIGLLPTIAGVTPTFAGAGGSSSEIVYQFPTPTVIDEIIILKMQFPPTLPLSCCKNSVDYCVKIQMITDKCEVCETTICLSDKPINSAKKGNKDKVSDDIDGIVSTKSIIINPNPASDFLNIELPQAQGTIYIYSASGNLVYEGDVTKKMMTVNSRKLESGNYIIKYENKEGVLTAKVVIN